MVCTVLASYPGHLCLVGGGGVWHACHLLSSDGEGVQHCMVLISESRPYKVISSKMVN